ncbi:MAG: hypothetical protein PHV08_00205 [Sulfurovaceae bacterium]|nr:hypothetical protein [Sulfurovaceae bacterium]
MRRIQKIMPIMIVVLNVLLSGCGALPAPKIQDYTFSKPPIVSDYEEAIKIETGKELKDPDSAKYNFGTPFKGYWRSASDNKIIWTGWIIPFEVNAKNSYGGYVGYTPYRAAIIDNNKVEVSAIMEVGIGIFSYMFKSFDEQ